MVDFLKAKDTAPVAAQKPGVRFEEAVQLFKARVDGDSSMKASSKKYRHLCIWKIKDTWPELWSRELEAITIPECRAWASRGKEQFASQYFNNVIGTLRLILEEGIEEQKRTGGTRLENPASFLTRASVRQKTLRLPEMNHFKSIVVAVRDGSRWGPKAADLATTVGGIPRLPSRPRFARKTNTNDTPSPYSGGKVPRRPFPHPRNTNFRCAVKVPRKALDASSCSDCSSR